MAPFGASRAGLMSVAGDDIPDSGEYHFVAEDLDSGDDDFVDRINDVSLSAIGSPSLGSDGLGGHNYVEYDGDDDGHGAASVDIIEQPFALISVVELLSTSGDNAIMSVQEDSLSAMLWDGDSRDSWSSWFGDAMTGSENDSENVVGVVIDGDESEYRESGEVTGTGDPGDRDIEDLAIGFNAAAPDRFGNIRFYESVVIADRDQSKIDEWESYFLSKYA